MYKYNPGYYVPVVVKSRDYLVGFLDALEAVGSEYQYDFSATDSQRFNDILPNNQRRRDLTDEQIIEVLTQYDESRNVKEVGIEKKVDIDFEQEQPYFEVNCSCGNYHAFNHALEIPKDKLECELCGKLLIDYTNVEEEEITYDGDEDRALIGFFDEEDEDED